MRKSDFEHAQNIILYMYKASSGPLLSIQIVFSIK